MTAEKQPLSRRKFLKGTGLAAGAAAASIAAPAVVTAQAPIVIKMQTSWPASDIWMDFARQYVERVEKMSAGRLKIDLLPAGAVVGAFQVLDAVNDGVSMPRTLCRSIGTGSTRPPRSSAPARCLAATRTPCSRGSIKGGGKEFYRELTQDILRLNLYGFYGFPMPAQPFGWFKNPVTTVADAQRVQVSHRRACR